MHAVDYLWDLWRVLLSVADDPSNDPREFKARHDEYARRYAKLSIAEQGELSERIHLHLKAWGQDMKLWGIVKC